MKIENISQRYIEHLREKRDRATERLKSANTCLTAAQQSYDEMSAWKTVIEDYKKRVEETNKAYDSGHKLILKLHNLAVAIVENVGCFSEAAETLVCIVREMALETDGLKRKINDLVNRLNSADKTRKYYSKIEDLNKKVDEAIISNVKAIVAILDLLKETYILNANLGGKLRRKFVVTELDSKWIEIEVGDNEWMEFYKKIIVIEELTTKNYGLVANIDHLHKLLENNDAFPLKPQEVQYLPFPLPTPSYSPTFPLNKEAYWKETMAQYKKVNGESGVEDDFDKVKNRLEKATIHRDNRKAALDAVEAALKAAESARTATGLAA